MISDNEKFNMQVKPNSAFLNELKSKLPEFFDREGNFDLDKFKGQLKEHNINELSDGYQLNFIGKDYARRQAGEMPSTVIVPDEEQNNGEGKDSKNLFFTGDNLEVLRHLQNNYAGKIDVIYIDPPYNTGNKDFVYPDKFEYSDGKLKEMFGMDDVQVERLKSIQGKSSHSAWLTFMYPRLYLAKNLLSKKGVIFVSIDDNEYANLYEILTDIYGEIQVDTLIWNKESEGKSGTLKAVSQYRRIHEYIVVAYVNKKDNKFNKIHEALEGRENEFNTANLAVNGSNEDINHSNYFTLTSPTGKKYTRQWKWSKEKINELINEDLIYWGKDGEKQPRLILPMDERRTVYLSSILNYGSTTSGREDFEKLFSKDIFSYPKPIKLLKKILEATTSKESIILDFFAGSSTTAEAVMQLNAKDSGSRRYIMIQIPESTFTVNSNGEKIPAEGGKTAYEAGFKSIDEISRERIRRAAAKIKADNDLTLPKNFDGSFKHYRVVNPTKQTLEDIEDFDPNNTTLFTDMVDSFSSRGLDVAGDATGEQTILTTWLAKDGYPFNADIKKIDFAGYEALLVEDSRLYIINNGWSSKNTEALLNKIGTHQIIVQTIVLFGYSFNIADLRELEIGLKQLDNNINLLKRY